MLQAKLAGRSEAERSGRTPGSHRIAGAGAYDPRDDSMAMYAKVCVCVCVTYNIGGACMVLVHEQRCAHASTHACMHVLKKKKE